jgi:hypothetical protein
MCLFVSYNQQNYPLPLFVRSNRAHAEEVGKERDAYKKMSRRAK